MNWILLARFRILFAIVSLLASTASFATILPPNDLDKEDDRTAEGIARSNVTEEQFHAIVEHIVKLWQPIAEHHGATLTASADWDDSTVNAYAQQSGKRWTVNFFGGLARRPEITPDGFALVVCHELGHHFAGHYFYDGGLNWAASEGQSDYFATQVCGRRIWKNSLEGNEEHLRYEESDAVQDECLQTWKSKEDVALCNRIADASLSLAKLLSALSRGPEPSVKTKDKRKVSRTNTSHPAAQCRLDTYLAGATCAANFDLGVIPGRGHSSGQNSSDAEKEAGKYSCLAADGHKVGVRPGCWFKSQLGSFDDDDGESDWLALYLR